MANAKWFGKEVMDNGLQHVVNNADEMFILDTYSAGQDYATVVSNACNLAHTITGTVDLADGASNARRVNIPAESIELNKTNPTPELHLAVCDSVTDTVLLVFRESTDQGITSGNTINTPATYAEIQQPA